MMPLWALGAKTNSNRKRCDGFLNPFPESLFPSPTIECTEEPTAESSAEVTRKVPMTDLLFIQQEFFQYLLYERSCGRHEAFIMST